MCECARARLSARMFMSVHTSECVCMFVYVCAYHHVNACVFIGVCEELV